jgi:hypothetical protein
LNGALHQFTGLLSRIGANFVAEVLHNIEAARLLGLEFLS